MAINSLNYTQLIKASLFVLGFEILRNFVKYFYSLSLLQFFRETARVIKMRALKSLMNIKNKSLDGIPSGVVIERVTGDCNKIANIIPSISDNIVTIVTNIGVIIAVFVISKIMFFFLLASSMIIFIFNNVRIKKWFEHGKRQRKENEKVTSFVAELVRGIRDIKVLNANKSFLDEAEGRIKHANKTRFLGLRSIRRYDLVIGTIHDILEFTLIMTGIVLLKNGNLNIAGLIAIYTYRERLYNLVLINCFILSK